MILAQKLDLTDEQIKVFADLNLKFGCMYCMRKHFTIKTLKLGMFL